MLPKILIVEEHMLTCLRVRNSTMSAVCFKIIRGGEEGVEAPSWQFYVGDDGHVRSRYNAINLSQMKLLIFFFLPFLTFKMTISYGANKSFGICWRIFIIR